ncbi:hypothetical protein BHE74_00017586 [Ensete ventricosum]|nr:hypothetical protein BHE74_00017586 [Ensete ventricosum]
MRSEKQAREGRESERAKGSGRLFVGVWGEGGGVVFIESNHLFALFVLLTTGKPYARPYEVIPTQMPLTSKLGGVGVGGTGGICRGRCRFPTWAALRPRRNLVRLAVRFPAFRNGRRSWAPEASALTGPTCRFLILGK